MTSQEEIITLDKVKGFLEQFQWIPETIEQTENQEYIITLVANLESKEIKIHIRFATTSLWIYFSAKFMQKPEKNACKLYEKLMQINFTTTLTKFGLGPLGNIYGLIELPTKDLDYGEFVSALRRLTNDINKYYGPLNEILTSTG